MRLEVLVGMIGTGKSTYARRRAGQGALVISHDDLTAMLHAGYRYEQGLREMYRRMEEDLVREALWERGEVVVDRTHLTRESRRRWLDFTMHVGRFAAMPDMGPVEVIAVAFPILTPEVHALRRFEADPRGRSYEDWLEVARHHYSQAMAEPPSADEGFAEIIRMGENP